jgi:hypothetical protein
MLLALTRLFEQSCQLDLLSKTFDFTPSPINTAEYDATFFPSAQTTYTYTLVGKIDNTPIHISYRCVPGAGDDTPGNNTKVAGGFGCPLPRGPALPPNAVHNSSL